MGLTAACWTFISTGRRKSHRERASVCLCVCVCCRPKAFDGCLPHYMGCVVQKCPESSCCCVCMCVWNSILLIPPTASVHTHGGFAGGGECFGFILYSTTHLRMPTPFHGTCVRVMRGRLIIVLFSVHCTPHTLLPCLRSEWVVVCIAAVAISFPTITTNSLRAMRIDQ